MIEKRTMHLYLGDGVNHYAEASADSETSMCLTLTRREHFEHDAEIVDEDKVSIFMNKDEAMTLISIISDVANRLQR